MERKCQTTKINLPRTSRVCDKIIEYYTKFGQDRDLEKFMRLYSPATSSSQDSGKTQNDEKDKCGHRRIRESQPHNTRETCNQQPHCHIREYCMIGSQSMPNITNLNEDRQYLAKTNATIPITMEYTSRKSNEELQTPEKLLEVKRVMTPDSIAKTHKRLEWDSLADVGYKKSISTTNISHLERSLLHELFKEHNTSEPSTSKEAAEKLHKSRQYSKQITNNETATPAPLASSTLLTRKPKMISQGTDMMDKQKTENYCQTTMLNVPQVKSKEIQVNFSSSTSLMDSTTTPSSFEYISSRSTKSFDFSSGNNNLDKSNEVQFIASLSDFLLQRRILGERQQQQQDRAATVNNIKNLQEKFLAAIDENKENKQHSSQSDNSARSTLSLTRSAPELDLGIQLICSLINAKSLNDRQKKRLVRDIVKRISRISGGEDRNLSPFPQQSQTQNKNVPSEISEDSVTPYLPQTLGSTPSNTGMPGSRQIVEDDKVDIISIRTGTTIFPNSYTPQGSSSDRTDDDTLIRVLVYTAPPSKNVYTEVRQTNSSTPTSTENIRHINKITEKQRETAGGFAKDKNTEKEKFLNNINSSSSVATTNIIPNEVVDNNSKSNAEQATMREWLNPITQSEIEYEERKRYANQNAKTEIEKPNKRNKRGHRSVGQSCGRLQQLNWIESEIKRLECLKYLLLRSDSGTGTGTTTDAGSIEQPTTADDEKTESSKSVKKKSNLLSEPIYDSVNSEKGTSDKSAKAKVHEIEVIIEESNEDVINLEEKLKKTRERKRETQLVYEEPLNERDATQKRAKFRSMRETTTIAEEQLLDDNNTTKNNYKQRQKVETPPPSPQSHSEGRDSLKKMVKQRKRDFIELYNHKKQQHYEMLKLQQQKQQQQQHKYRDNKYSLINKVPDKIEQQSQNGKKEPSTNPSSSARTTEESTDMHTQTNSTSITSSISIATTSTSSTSIYNTSTDVSVSLSMSSSTLTSTTHKSTGVAIQTSDSLLRSVPIYGPSMTRCNTVPGKRSVITRRTDKTISTTTGIQVKPKGIAYVIEFTNDDKTPNSTNEENAVEIDSKTDIPALASTTTYITNNMKTYDRDDPEQQPMTTLQEHLEKAKPKFMKHSVERQHILQQMQEMRQARDRQLREIIDNTSFNSLNKRLRHLPPPPTERVRVLNTKEMKALTNKRFTQLPEVVARRQREQEEKQRRGNRILRDIFNQRLQERVRTGKLSLNHSKTVI